MQKVCLRRRWNVFYNVERYTVSDLKAKLFFWIPLENQKHHLFSKLKWLICIACWKIGLSIPVRIKPHFCGHSMEGELVPSSTSLYFAMRSRTWGWEGYQASCRDKVTYLLLRCSFSIQALVCKPTAAMQQGGEICGLTWLSRPCHPWGHGGDRVVSPSKGRSCMECHLKTFGVRRDHKVMARWKTTPFGRSFFGRKKKGWTRVRSWGGI